MNKQKLVANRVEKAEADLKVAEDEPETVNPASKIKKVLLLKFDNTAILT